MHEFYITVFPLYLLATDLVGEIFWNVFYVIYEVSVALPLDSSYYVKGCSQATVALDCTASSTATLAPQISRTTQQQISGC